MEGKNDFDRIREKTGIDKLEDTQRKRLFRDFVDHGGKVIQRTEAQKKDALKTLDTSSKGKKTSGINSSSPDKNQLQALTSKKPSLKRGKINAPKAAPRKPAKQFRLNDLIKIYVKGIMLKVVTFRGNRFSEKFINYFLKDVKESLIDLEITMDSFLKGDGSIRKEIYQLSIGENSAFYEFMLRMGSLYDEQEFGEIAKCIAGGSVPKIQQAPLFKRFFVRVYVLAQFLDLCKLYIDKALEIQSRHRKMNPALVPSIRAQLRKDINVILDDLLLKFHVLLCRIDRTFLPLYSQRLDDFLGMTEKDKIGYITREERKRRLEELKKQKEYLKRQQEEIQEREREAVRVPKHVERGFPLLEASGKQYALIHKGDPNDPLPLMGRDDKMYRAYLFLDVFDNEYSFVLTTGKINFNIDYREQKKIDIKEDLGQSYILLNEAKEEVKDYIGIVREIRKTQDNMRLTLHQKSQMLDALSRKQSVVSKNAREKIADAMKSADSVLSVIIGDYNASKRLLQNPEEELFFDKSIDGDKKLDGKKTIEAIVEAFLYASAFCFLLRYGELSGSGVRVEQPVQANAPGAVKALYPQRTPAAPSPGPDMPPGGPSSSPAPPPGVLRAE
jgi:hypothetical protein